MIAFGQAGGKILDKFVEYDERTGSDIVAHAVAINSAKTDLMGLEHVDNRLLIGQSRVKGHGVGADNELGTSIAQEDIDEIQGAIDEIPVHELDAFLIIAGLGGGTGSGGAPVLARRLKLLYTEPVYALGVLPAIDEGSLYSLNAARSFKTLVGEVDNLLLFDNDAWRKAGETVETGYGDINDEIVRRFGILFGAGEARSPADVGESVVDASEIINTLGVGGVSTVGFAATRVDARKKNSGGLFRRPPKDNDLEALDTSSATNRITSLVRSAALGRLTLPCEIEGAERALIVVAGPREHLDRKGIERARTWLEERTGSMVVRGGDYPISDTNHVAAVVLLAGVTNVPRIKELQRIAVEAIDRIDALEHLSASSLDQLVNEDEGEIEPLF